MSERPSVLYLCGWPVGPNGEGSASFVHDQVVQLSSQVNALFVEHAFASVVDFAKSPIKTLRSQPIRGAWPSSVRARRVKTIRLPTSLTRRTVLADLRHAGAALARRMLRYGLRIDIIHAHVALPAGLIAAHAAAELDVPMVLQEHSGPFGMHLDTSEKMAAVNEVLRAATSVLAVSNALAKDIRAAFPESNVTTMPNLVRTDIFRAVQSPVPSEELRLVSVGGLLRVKNQAAQIACLAELVSQGVSASLTLVGDGPLKEELAWLARDLGVENRVTFLGQASRAATANAIAAAHIYICSSEIETFGLAVAEALAVGRPVVTTACGGPEEIVDSTLGVVVSSAHPDALATAVVELADRLDQCAPGEMHANIDRRFGPGAFEERMLKIYDQVGSAPSQRVELPV